MLRNSNELKTTLSISSLRLEWPESLMLSEPSGLSNYTLSITALTVSKSQIKPNISSEKYIRNQSRKICLSISEALGINLGGFVDQSGKLCL